jgi:hypothetical protein
MKFFNRIPCASTVTRRMLGALFLGGALAGCQPTVKIEAPSEPITINLNIKLDADIRVKIEEEANEEIAANPDIF